LNANKSAGVLIRYCYIEPFKPQTSMCIRGYRLLENKRIASLTKLRTTNTHVRQRWSRTRSTLSTNEAILQIYMCVSTQLHTTNIHVSVTTKNTLDSNYLKSRHTTNSHVYQQHTHIKAHSTTHLTNLHTTHRQVYMCPYPSKTRCHLDSRTKAHYQ
jgi:hypothetical protein